MTYVAGTNAQMERLYNISEMIAFQLEAYRSHVGIHSLIPEKANTIRVLRNDVVKDENLFSRTPFNIKVWVRLADPDLVFVDYCMKHHYMKHLFHSEITTT